MQTVKRDDVKEILVKWQKGEMSAVDVNEWAGELYLNDSVIYTDWDKEENNSVTNEVLAALDCMNMNLLLPEDIPAYLDFLETPRNDFETGYENLQGYLKSINYQQRRSQLSKDPFYAPFCK